MSEKLLPCPFCGRSEVDIREVRVDKLYTVTPRELRYVCRWCDATGPALPDTDAIAAWNKRVEPPKEKD